MRIDRADLTQRLRRAIKTNPVTALYGPRQCGKTTIARQMAQTGGAGYFDLEDPVSQRRLAEPMTALRPLRGLVVIDEVQRQPDLFPALRVLADRKPLPARFLVLGSASPELLRQSSESLAGRVAFVEMSGFELAEAGPAATRRLWWRGGFPRSFLAPSDGDSRVWQENFIRTFLERDIREYGVQVTPPTLRRMWSMLAHYHGQIWNASELSRSLGEAHTTVKRHLDILTGALMVRQLQPWHENLGKRQVKAPRIYFTDTGLLHAVLGLRSMDELEAHPRLGASWEGFAIGEVMARPALREAEWYFWRTHTGAELDLLAIRGRQRIGFEFKHGRSPGLTPSMRIALADLKLDRLVVVHAGSETYSLGDRVTACPLAAVRI